MYQKYHSETKSQYRTHNKHSFTSHKSRIWKSTAAIVRLVKNLNKTTNVKLQRPLFARTSIGKWPIGLRLRERCCDTCSNFQHSLCARNIKIKPAYTLVLNVWFLSTLSLPWGHVFIRGMDRLIVKPYNDIQVNIYVCSGGLVSCGLPAFS